MVDKKTCGDCPWKTAPTKDDGDWWCQPQKLSVAVPEHHYECETRRAYRILRDAYREERKICAAFEQDLTAAENEILRLEKANPKEEG